MVRKCLFIFCLCIPFLSKGSIHTFTKDSLHRRALTDAEIYHLIDSLIDAPHPDQFIISQLTEYINIRQKNINNSKVENEFEHKWDEENVNCSENTMVNINDTVTELNKSDYYSNYKIPAKGIITSDYGWRKRSFHSGVDIDLNTGDEVYASFDGIIKIAKVDRGYGKVVVIKHSNGLETTYAHLSKFKVKAGETVVAGTVIGLGGNTGRSRGSHLHYEVRYNGIPINPNYLISNKKLPIKIELTNKENKIYKKPITDINKMHRVQKGDSLYRIAKQYGISLKELKSLNGIKNNTKLRIGTELRVG